MDFNGELLQEATNCPLSCALLISESIKDSSKKQALKALIAAEYLKAGDVGRAEQVYPVGVDGIGIGIDRIEAGANRTEAGSDRSGDLQELSLLFPLLEKSMFDDAVNLARTWFDPYLKGMALVEIYRAVIAGGVQVNGLDVLVEEHLTILEVLCRREREKLRLKSGSVYFSFGMTLGILLAFLFILQWFLR
jgi:hypothetical protein